MKSGTQTEIGTRDVSYNYCNLLGFNIRDMPRSIATAISNSYFYWLLYFLTAKTGILFLNRPRPYFSFTMHVHRTLDCRPLNLGPKGCPETSVRNCHHSLGNDPEERSSHRTVSFVYGQKLERNYALQFDGILSERGLTGTNVNKINMEKLHEHFAARCAGKPKCSHNTRIIFQALFNNCNHYRNRFYINIQIWFECFNHYNHYHNKFGNINIQALI